MKRLSGKHMRPPELLPILLISAVSLTALVFFYFAPLETDDAVLTSLLGAAIPRFFISAFLLAVILYFYPKLSAFSRVSPKNLLWCVPLFLVVFANFPLSALVTGSARVARADMIALFAVKCFLIGLSEELLFRGILFDFLRDCFRQKYKTVFLPVLVSSVVFALFHLVNLLDGAGILPVLQQIGYSFLIGAMLAVLFVRTENLCLCVIVHALFDFGGLLVSDLGTGNPHDTVFWILTVVFGVLCAIHVTATLVKLCRKPS